MRNEFKRNNILYSLICNMLFMLYQIDKRCIRTSIIWCVKKLEKGELYSHTLRRIFKYYHGINIGMYSYGGCFSVEQIPSGTEIGRYCSFASRMYIFNGNHPIHNRSLHPFFYNPMFGMVDEDMIQRSKLIIGHDVWIGYNAIILPSVSEIGDGAIIGAGSIVTKNVPSFAVVAGNPAKIIKYRFSEKMISRMKEVAWWNNNIDDLRKELSEFTKSLE